MLSWPSLYSETDLTSQSSQTYSQHGKSALMLELEEVCVVFEGVY
eukprot:SAG25_NODE_618_length_6422_cov_3.817894_10_plen_45_part_00